MNKRLLVLVLVCLVAQCGSLNAQWVHNAQSFGGQVHAFASIGTNLFAAVYGNGVFLSTDNGTSWTPVDSGLTSNDVWCLAASETTLFAGTYQGAGVYRSTNNGRSWSPANGGLDYQSTFTLFAAGPTALFAGTDYGAYYSPNAGSTWILLGLGQYSPVYSFALGDTNLFAGTSDGEVYRWLNSSQLWTQTDTLYSLSIYSLAASGTNVFAGTRNVYYSSNSGMTWMVDSAGIPNGYINTFAINGSDIYAGTDHGVFRSTVGGNGWTDENAGLSPYPLNNVDALIAFAGYIFAGTNVGVYRRPLSEVTSVEAPRAAVPVTYTLEQNYPNPFNPTTVISFHLPVASSVRLAVFDILGRLVSVLVDGKMEAGVREVKFDGSNLASGVYFYRLQAGDFTQTKRLTLLK